MEKRGKISSDRQTIDTKSYQKILKHFINEWKNGDPNKREDHIKTLVRRVTSNVDRDKNDTIEVEYIAEELSLSPQTIHTYRTRIKEKLNISSNVEMTRYAIEHNLIE